jgi:multiple sugar transport system substrate-binding protein
VSNLNDKILRGRMNRRTVLKSAAGAAAGISAFGLAGKSYQRALAQDSVKDQILKIPGAGNGQPTEADMQKVGELTLGPTKAVIQPGEFKGVQIRFMGLNNLNLHDFLFRAFLKSWEDYTGASISWVDLSQADYNGRLQQAIATGTVDFDILEMGAPYEGDVLGRGLASEMPDWVKQMTGQPDELVNYLKPPVGAWNGKLYRLTIDGDTHNFNYRSDYFADKDLAAAWTKAGGQGDWGVPTTWQQVQAQTKFLKGQKIGGQDAYGYLDTCKPGGGFTWYFFASRATAYVKYPGNPAWLFDPDTMKPYVNNPGFVRAIQDIKDALPYEPAGEINADLNTSGFKEFLGGTGAAVAWWGDIGSNVYTNDQSVVQDKVSFSILPGSDDVFNNKTGQFEKLSSGPNFSPNEAYLGWGIYVMATVDKDPKLQKATWSIAGHLGGKDLSLWTACYPSGFQPYRTSHFNVDDWVTAGYKKDYATAYLKSEADSYNHPNGAIEPRLPGIFQYYSSAEDELAKAWAGQDAKTTADNIAAAWEKLTDSIGRDNQIKAYQAALGEIGGKATPTS